MTKVEMKSDAEDIFSELKNELKLSLIPVYIKRKQAASMESVTKNVDGKTIALQVDFTKNATMASQNKIQYAHWQHSEATLLTAHAWISKEVGEMIVIISDDLEHTKLAVYAFMSKILAILR